MLRWVLVLAWGASLTAFRARADEWPAPWTTADTAREIALASVAVVDVIHTIRATGGFLAQQRCAPAMSAVQRAGVMTVEVTGAHCLHSTEENPLLGPRPSDAQVIAYASVGLLAHAAVAAALPRRWRTPWQWVVIAIDASVVARSAASVHTLGLGIKW